METKDKEDRLATSVTITEKRVCKCCGKELPITYFDKSGRGYRKTCIACERESSGVSDKFKAFTARELMEELRSRGFKGELKWVRTETFKL